MAHRGSLVGAEEVHCSIYITVPSCTGTGGEHTAQAWRRGESETAEAGMAAVRLCVRGQTWLFVRNALLHVHHCKCGANEVHESSHVGKLPKLVLALHTHVCTEMPINPQFVFAFPFMANS